MPIGFDGEFVDNSEEIFVSLSPSKFKSIPTFWIKIDCELPLVKIKEKSNLSFCPIRLLIQEDFTFRFSESLVPRARS